MEAGTSALHQQAAELRTRETQGCRTQGSRTKDLNRHIYIYGLGPKVIVPKT